MEGRKFLDFLDMIDGGGAGQMGDKFEGGGLFSALGNLGGSPYGSEDEKRRAAREAFYSSQNIGGAPMASTPPPQVIPNAPAAPANAPVGSGMTPANNYVAPPAQSPMEMFGGQPPAAYTPPPPQYSGRGYVGMPVPEGMSPEAFEVIKYLRSVGATNY